MDKYALIASADKFDRPRPAAHNQAASPAMPGCLPIKRRIIDLSLLIPLLIVGLVIGLKPAGSRAQETVTVDSSVYCRFLALDTADCGRVRRVTNRGWASAGNEQDNNLVFTTENLNPQDSGDPVYCLTMDVSLDAGSRIDFSWALRVGNAGNTLQFSINNSLQQTIPTSEVADSNTFRTVQQYADYHADYSEIPITSLQWCHRFPPGTDSAARLGRLNFVLPSEISPSPAPPTRVDYCSALNLNPGSVDSLCDDIVSVEPIFPDYPWRTNTFEVVENTGPEIGPNSISLRAAVGLPNGAESCVRLNFRSELSLDTQIVFYGQAYSEANNDFFKFYGGEQELYSLTGVRNFRRIQRVILDPTLHLTWCYEKNDNDIASQDTARIDVLRIEAPATAAQSQTTDFPGFCNQWLISGFNCDQSNSAAVTFTADYPWEIQSGVLTNTSDLINNAQSCVSVKVPQLPLWSRISFRWRADIHSSDFLGFYINGRLLGQVTNTGSSYRNTSFVADQFENIGDTASVLSWCYVTDEADTAGDDFIGLDDVRLDATEFHRTGFNQADYCEQLDATDQCSLFSGMTFSSPPGVSGPWGRIAANSPSGYPLNSIQSQVTSFNQRSCFILPGLNLQTDTVIAFQWAIVSDQNEDFFRFRTTDGVSESAAAHLSISGQSGTVSNRFEQVQFRVIDPSQARTASWCVENNPTQSIIVDAVGQLAQLKFYSLNDQPVVDNLSAICSTLGLSAGECGLISRARTNARQNLWAHQNVTVDSSLESVLRAPNHSPHTPDEPIYRQSCLTLDVNLPAQTRIGFRWRLTTDDSIDNASDRFRFLINGSPQDSIGPDNSFQFDRFTASGEVSELSWCHQINGDFDAFTKGNAEFYDLSFDIPEQRASDLQAVCAALDIASTDCRGRVGLDLINNARHTGAVPWDISSNQAIDSLRGDNALLNNDLRGFAESCYTLDTLIRLASGQSVGFFWRLNGSSGDSIRFVAISGGELGRLSGNGEDSGWQVVNVAGPRTIISLQWCYQNPSFASGEYAVVDGLAVGPALTIAPRPGGQRQPLDNAGLQRFQVDVNAQQDYGGTIARSEVELALLSHSSDIEISALAVERWTNTAAQLYALDFTVQFDAQRLLRDGTTSGQADALFNIDIPGFPSTQAGGYQIQVANSALLRDVLCQVLDVSTSDCSAITAEAVSNTSDYPWVITSEAERVLAGAQALTLVGRQITGIPQLHYRLAVDVSLPAGTAIQFHRLTDTNSCESLRFAINNFTWLESVSQAFATSEAYMPTRLYAETAVPITRLTWDYRDLSTEGQLCRTIHSRLASPETGASSRVWIDQMSFIPPVTTVSQLCSILDVDNDDCALITAVTTPATPWVEMLNTGANNSLRPHPGVSNNQSSCLILDVNLPAATRVDFELAYNLPSSGDRFRLYEGLEVQNDLVVSADGMHETHRQQRFFSNPVRTLRWCLDKGDNAAVDGEFVELNRLSFTSGSAARLLPDQQFLCGALDLNSTVCPLVDSFTQSPEHLLWRNDTEVTPVRGDSVISAPATLPGETSCLNLAFSGLQAGLTVRFNWRVDASTADTLSFRINGSQVQSLQGTGATSSWVSVSQPPASAETVINSLQWCYVAGSGSTSVGQAWIDNLQFGFATSALTATAPIQAANMPNRFSFVVTVTASHEDGNLPASPQFLLEPQTLGISSLSYVVTAQSGPGTGLFRRAFAVTADFELDALVESGILRLSQPSWPLTGNPQSEVAFNDLAELRRVTVCRALALNGQDCNRLTAVSSTADYPWRVTTATFQVGENLLSSAGAVPADGESCLTLTLNLEAGSRIDFNWSVHSLSGDSLQFSINNLPSTIGIEGTLPVHRQQRFSNVAINTLNWCYRKDSSGESEQDRGWLDQLGFLPPDEALLLADKQALCRALDLSAADCAAISTFSQAPDSLSWGVTTDSELMIPSGGSALGSPLTVTADENACLTLTLQTDLPEGTAVNFSWRIDGASSSALNLQINGAPAAGISINGPATGAAGNWQTLGYTSARALNSLGWCYRRGAGFAGSEQGWLDQLSLEPPFTAPQIILATTPTRVTDDDNRVWQFQVRINAASGAPALPAGLRPEVTLQSNISTFTITAQDSDATMSSYRISITLRTADSIGNIHFGLGSLPAAVEPTGEELRVEIEPLAVALVIPALARLVNDPGADNAISLPDLLLGLRIVNNLNPDTFNTNLPQDVGGDSASDMEAFTNLLGNQEQSGVIDIDENNVVDSLDFRLMLRYRAGLRGAALCDEFCLLRLQLLLDQ